MSAWWPEWGREAGQSGRRCGLAPPRRSKSWCCFCTLVVSGFVNCCSYLSLISLISLIIWSPCSTPLSSQGVTSWMPHNALWLPQRLLFILVFHNIDVRLVRLWLSFYSLTPQWLLFSQAIIVLKCVSRKKCMIKIRRLYHGKQYCVFCCVQGWIAMQYSPVLCCVTSCGALSKGCRDSTGLQRWQW